MNAVGYVLCILVSKAVRTVLSDYLHGFETYERCDSQCMQCMKDDGFRFYAARIWDQVTHFDAKVIANMKDAHRTELSKYGST